MMSLNKRMISCICLLFMFVNFAIPVFATQNECNDFSTDTLDEYVNAKAYSILQIHKLYSSESLMQISQGFPIENDADLYNYLYFLFADNDVLGFMIAGYSEGKYYSSFVQQQLSEVQYALNVNAEINCFVYNEGIYLRINNTYVQLCGIANESVNHIECIPYSTTTYGEHIVISQITFDDTTYSSLVSRGSTPTSLDVRLENYPVKPNMISPDTKYGVCWCAAIASIGQYKTSRSLSTWQLYNWLNANCNDDLLNPYPTGNGYYHAAAFGYYGLTATCYDGGLDFYSVLGLLSNDIPVYCIISGLFWNNTQNKYVREYHSVVICGAIVGEYNDYYYLVMDPNYPSLLTISLSDCYTTYFSYDGYTTWNARYY